MFRINLFGELVCRKMLRHKTFSYKKRIEREKGFDGGDAEKRIYRISVRHRLRRSKEGYAFAFAKSIGCFAIPVNLDDRLLMSYLIIKSL